MLKIIAGAIAAATLTAPASALLVTSIELKSAAQTDRFLQVAELIAIQAGTGDNVALATRGSYASALSSYTENSGPEKAIDGNTSGAFSFRPVSSIYHSAGSDTDEYLLVTLGQAYNLSSLTVYGRADSWEDRDIYRYTLFNGSTAVGTGILDARNNNHFATASLGAAAVPEPASWALMIGGFGVVGSAVRRRQSVKVTYA